jgi:plastocyanin
MQSKNLYPGKFKLLLYCLFNFCCFYAVATTHTIQVGDYYFSPTAVNAAVGDTILFSWVSGSHTTTSTSVPGGANSWNSPMNSTNTSFQYVLTTAGTYNFHCNIHPSLMSGTLTVGSATAIEETASVTEIGIYPNPTNGKIQVTAPWPIKAVEIFDVLGNTVYSAPANSDIPTIDLSGQANGIYFMRLLFTNHAGVGMKKIIVNNVSGRQ